MTYDDLLDAIDKGFINGEMTKAEAKELVLTLFPPLFEPIKWTNLTEFIENHALKTGVH